MRLDPYLAVIFGATLGASGGVFAKILGLPSTSLSFFRLFVPVVILFFYLLWKKVKLFRGNFGIMLVASALNAVRIFLYFFAFLNTSLANGIIILFTWPIFGALFGAVFLKEKLRLRTCSLIGLAFVGIIVMYLNKDIRFGSSDFIGICAMLLSAMIFAFTAVIFKKNLEYYSRSESIFYQNLVGAVLFLPFMFINQPFPSFFQISIASLYAFLVGIVGFGLFFYALHKLDMSHYSLFAYWEVVAAIIFGIVLFGEVIAWNIVVGGSLIVVSGLLLRKKKVEVPDTS